MIRWAAPAAAMLAFSTAPAAASTRALAGGCEANQANGHSSLGAATQVITVETPRAETTVASLRLWQRAGSCWTPVARSWRARVGRNGVSNHKREGDGATPAGVYRIGPIAYGIAPNPGTRLAYHRLSCGDWWDEDPRSWTYNTFRHVTCGRRPTFGGASEALWKETVAYQRFAVVQYNASPIVPGRGSAIFVHDDVGGPTNGCVSLPPAALDRTLRWLRPSPSALVVIGTAAELRRS
jgi:L,D-peptidoglycan transpeptidase YkuD (ErfK/YbiS/YcfS/YnhG family)